MAFTPTDPLKAEVRVTGTAPNQTLDFYIPRGPKGDPGGLTTTVLAAGTKLNDVLTEGSYQCTISADAATSILDGLPMHEAGSLMVTKSGSNSVQIQTYTTNTKGIYVRRRFSGAWSAWRFFGHTRTDQTAGRAIYTWDELNQREQLIYGDTGWRDIVGLYTGGVVTSPQLRIRRIGQMTTLMFQGYPPTGATAILTNTIPAGFRPSVGLNMRYAAMQIGNTTSPHATVSSGNSLSVDQATGSGEFTVICTYPTSDAWPTTLPGTAVGNIPSV